MNLAESPDQERQSLVGAMELCAILIYFHNLL